MKYSTLKNFIITVYLSNIGNKNFIIAVYLSNIGNKNFNFVVYTSAIDRSGEIHE
ncbi:unnamed protein product [marine sediment metagenome]|uniref:Uncharacterized protein n=1 Tax=marine sediment metagenome TaxID=412755 RepID=X0T1H8_9ZZZZ